jgi:replicative DNA helicase
MKPNKNLALIPPNALEMEQAVLGALLLEKNAMYEVKDMLTEDMFFNDSHRLIYQAIHSLFSASKPVDLLTVSAWLREAGKLEQVGNLFYLSELTSKVASSAHIKHHCFHIIDKYLRRDMILKAQRIQTMAWDETIELDHAEVELDSIKAEYRNVIARLGGVESVTLDKAYLQLIRSMEKQQASDVPYGLLTGKHFMDDYLGAIEPGLIIIAGRPGMGKTTFGMWLSYQLAKNGHAGAFIGLELTQFQVMRRYMAMIAGISLDYIKNPKLLKAEDWNRINQAKVPNNLVLPDMSSPYVNLLCMEIEHQVRKGAKFVIVDQLNFIKEDPRYRSFSKNDELGNITRPLAQLAKKLEIPIMLLHQLNRKASEDEPELHHLRDSGNIEQDARVVILLDVPFKRGVKELADGSSSQNRAVIKIAKNGEGEAPLRSIPTYRPELFTYDDDQPEPYFAPKIDFQPSIKHSDIMPF